MSLALQYENQIGSKVIKKTNILTVIIIALLLLLIFSFKLNNNTTPNFNGMSNPTNSLEFTTPSNNGFILGVFIITAILAFLVPLGVFVENKPKAISEILNSQYFEISFKVDADGQEYALIDLQYATLQIQWIDLSGQPQNWKMSISLNIKDNFSSYTQLAKLLFMERAKSNKNVYQKHILAKDWTRQDYLLQYWIKGLEF